MGQTRSDQQSIKRTKELAFKDLIISEDSIPEQEVEKYPSMNLFQKIPHFNLLYLIGVHKCPDHVEIYSTGSTGSLL